MDELVWMVKHGFANALVIKNAEGRTVTMLLAAAIKHLQMLVKKRKKENRAESRPRRKLTVRNATATAMSLGPKGGPGMLRKKSPKRSKSPKAREKAQQKTPPLSIDLAESLHRLGNGGIDSMEPILKILKKQEEDVARALRQKAAKAAEKQRKKEE